MTKVLVSDKIIVPFSAPDALSVIWEIKHIEKYEPKLESVEVKRETEKTGTYTTKGKFAGIPWKGRFSYEITDKGFYSELIEEIIPGLEVGGGFIVVAKTENECQVTHYEQYKLPWFLIFLAPLLKTYLQITMKQELKDLEQIIKENVKV